MRKRPGRNETLFLHALSTLERQTERRSFSTALLLDAVWSEIEKLHCCALASPSDVPQELAEKVRRIKAAHCRVLVARNRAAKKPRLHAAQRLALQSINPARCLRTLIKRGLVERSAEGLALTEF